jgi:ABC-type transport system involved in cytochrome c biogenesis permease subunit
VIAWWLTPKDKPETFAVQEFGRLPVLTNGRIQPIDSLARNSLLQLREKQTANLEPWKSVFFEHPQIISGTEWAMGMMMNPQKADQWPVFRIDHPELKSLLGLPAEADKEKHDDGKHYSWSQLSPKLQELQDESRRVSALEAPKRNQFDNAVSKLWNAVAVYMRLQNTLQPQNAKDWAAEQAAYQQIIPAGVDAVRNQQAGKPFDKAVFQQIMEDIQRFDTMSQVEPPALIPPPAAARASREWKRTGAALLEAARKGGVDDEPQKAIKAYARMASAYKNDQWAFFNQAVADYRASLLPAFATELRKTEREQFFNAYEPFIKAMTIYIFAGLCVLVFWFAPRRFEPLRRGAFWLMVLAFIVQFGGLLFRMIQEGRPPVTNLYSSAIFIGTVACFLCIFIEAFWRYGIGIMISSIVGFGTLIIAHHLALAGDTMEMMRAVLDSNFWLATHVVAVTFGYAATFAAGICAVLYIFLRVFTPVLTLIPEINKVFSKIAYAIICFAVLFSFVGTVLGGIWADQSWGRFWGWDPKENGALIIVLWNAIVLHARWGGLVRERGLMNMIVFGNIVTAWSWFGVNMLGIGLHSYGFTSGESKALGLFILSQVVIIGIGLVPKSLWPGHRVVQAGLPPPLPA